MNTLLIFAKWPTPGVCKTRLIPALGADGAASLHRTMVARTLLLARRYSIRTGARIVLYSDGATPMDFQNWLGPDLECFSQCEGDLGRRLRHAFASHLSPNDKVCIIGADCPLLDEEDLADAFHRLDSSDVVLGPAADGGYYLIGLRAQAPDLFNGIAWGSDQVFQQTLQTAMRNGLSTQLLRTLNDVDRPEDLAEWENSQRKESETFNAPEISVIIPAINEAASMANCMASASAPGVQIILADGGSTDGTREIAEAYGAQVVQCPPGRALQMNAGTQLAKAPVYLFLHADTLLPNDFVSKIKISLQDVVSVGGAFRLRLDSKQPGFRVIERGANWRSRVLGLPYGDQALFIRAEIFQRIGGYPDQPIMEDVALVRAMRKFGYMNFLDSSVTSSARRWIAGGVIRTTMLHLLALVLYFVGLPPARIAKLLKRLGRREHSTDNLQSNAISSIASAHPLTVPITTKREHQS